MSGTWARVYALTMNPDFVDVYDPVHATYKPSAAGEVGFMAPVDAEAARDAGDVKIHIENTPLELDLSIPKKLDVRVHGSLGPIDIVHFEPGIWDGIYTATVTLAIDGGGDLTAQATTASGDNSADTAQALAGEIVAGVTLLQDLDKKDVIFTADSGGFTKFEVAVT